MILPIYTYGEKILSTKGEKVEKDYKDLKDLLDNMFETMHQAGGIGLAAQQVGLALQLFVIDLTGYKGLDPKLELFKKVFINSEILELEDDEFESEEGCLSVPLIKLKVKRPSRVKLKYLNHNFDPIEEWFDGLAARCILHEFDHTQGKTLVNHMSPLKKNLLKSKLQTILKKNFNSNYKIKI